MSFVAERVEQFELGRSHIKAPDEEKCVTRNVKSRPGSLAGQ